jgi:hypothetical protein
MERVLWETIDCETWAHSEKGLAMSAVGI